MTIPSHAEGAPGPSLLGTGDIDTMQAPTSTRTPDTTMTLPPTCLFSAASARLSISTGKERDTESGNDYFGARYYTSNGPVHVPDWAAKAEPVPYAKLDDPQSLNLYGYVLNNPLSKADPDGHCTDPVSCGLEFAGIGTLIEPGGGTAVGAVLGAGVGLVATYFVGKAIADHISSNSDAPAPTASTSPAPTAGTTPVPTGLVGTDPSPTKGRTNSGPLAPDNGGSGDAGKDFGTLTGGKGGAPQGSTYPPGTQVGDNGIALRPAAGKSGPRIDIPANGSKPHETLHYPPPPPPPPPTQPKP